MGQHRTAVAHLIQQIREANDRANYYSEQLSKATTRGKAQALRASMISNAKRVKSYLNRLSDMSKGAIIQVDFKVLSGEHKDQRYRVVYTNMEERDAKELVKLHFQIQNIEIEILECSRIVTQNEFIPL